MPYQDKVQNKTIIHNLKERKNEKKETKIIASE